MNCKTLEDFKVYAQNCSIEELLTLSKDCDFAHINNYFKADSICDAIYGNICDNEELPKAFAIVACNAILATMCDTVAYEVLHRIANKELLLCK